MANYNKSAFIRIANKKGLSGYQLILRGAEQLTVKGFLYQGYAFMGLSKYTTDRIELLLDDIACVGVKQAHEYFSGQVRETRDISWMQFSKESYIEILDQVVNHNKNDISTIYHWFNVMKLFHEDNGQKAAKMLKNKDMRLCGEWVITNEDFKFFLTQYCKENEKELYSDEAMASMIDNYVDDFNKKYEIEMGL